MFFNGLLARSCSPAGDSLRLLASGTVITHSCRKTEKRERRIIKARQMNGGRENLRRSTEKWQIHVLFSTSVCSTNVESENNLDVCARRCWMRWGHRRRGEDDRRRNRKRPRGTPRRKTNNRINCFLKERYTTRVRGSIAAWNRNK